MAPPHTPAVSIRLQPFHHAEAGVTDLALFLEAVRLQAPSESPQPTDTAPPSKVRSSSSPSTGARSAAAKPKHVPPHAPPTTAAVKLKAVPRGKPVAKVASGGAKATPTSKVKASGRKRWCEALPLDAVPGPLVPFVLNEWLPLPAVSVAPELALRYCDIVTMPKKAFEKDIVAVLEKAQRASKLQCRGCFLTLSTFTPPPNLTSLDLPQCSLPLRAFGGPSTYPLRSATSLTSINLLCSDVAGDGIVAALPPTLTFLDLSYTGVVCPALAVQCPRLETVRFLGCMSLVDGAIADVAQLPNLTHLAVSSASAITAAVEVHIQAMRSLRRLSINGLQVGVTAACINALFGLPLEDLSCKAYEVDDALVRRNTSRLPSLTALDLSTTLVTGEGLACLSDCPHLTSLSLLRCRSVTDAGIRVVSKACPRLRKLNVIDCERLSPAVVAEISGRPGLDVKYQVSV